MAGTEPHYAGGAIPPVHPERAGESGNWGRRAKWLIRPRLVLSVTGMVLALLVGLEFFRVIFGANLHTVIPGKVYRSAQPSIATLQQLVRDHGIRTVVNLRGTSPDLGWYQNEAQATFDLDLNQEDITMSAYRLPSASEMRQLVEILDHAEYPILLHCRRGSDRTGLTAAAVMLLQDGVSLEQALGNLSWRFGHIELGRGANLDSFFGYYKEWLAGQNLTHSPEQFRHWVQKEYRGGPCGCAFESWKLPPEPIRVGKPFALTVHVRNNGSQPWRLSPFPLAGAHLHYVLIQPDGSGAFEKKTGFIDAQVKPGDGIELTVPLSISGPPGQYPLRLDMCDEQMGEFVQMGSEPLELRLDVRE